MARCGTPTGYKAHQRREEKPCDACVAAKREYDRRRKDAPGVQRADRLRARAQNRAYSALAHRYPDEYAALYAAFKVEAFADDEEQAS